MNNRRATEWLLRLTIAAIFAGHGITAMAGNETWMSWIELFTGVGHETAKILLFLDGILDVLVAGIVLVRPFKLVLFWAAFWGYFTGIIGVLMGESFLTFFEEIGNWAIPLALYFFRQSEQRSQQETPRTLSREA